MVGVANSCVIVVPNCVGRVASLESGQSLLRRQLLHFDVCNDDILFRAIVCCVSSPEGSCHARPLCRLLWWPLATSSRDWILADALRAKAILRQLPQPYSIMADPLHSAFSGPPVPLQGCSPSLPLRSSNGSPQRDTY